MISCEGRIIERKCYFIPRFESGGQLPTLPLLQLQSLRRKNSTYVQVKSSSPTLYLEVGGMGEIVLFEDFFAIAHPEKTLRNNCFIHSPIVIFIVKLGTFVSSISATKISSIRNTISRISQSLF